MAAALLTAGCSYVGTARAFDPAEFSLDPRWIRCGDVPVILQKEQRDCGAAAAAMLLARWKRPVPLEEVASFCRPEGDRRIAAARLKAVLESKGLQAFVVQGTFGDLEQQVRKGRPVIAGLVKPHVGAATPHYEVVVAVHPVERRIVTIDPARGWRQNDLDGFFAEWEPAGRLLIAAWEPE